MPKQNKNSLHSAEMKKRHKQYILVTIIIVIALILGLIVYFVTRPQGKEVEICATSSRNAEPCKEKKTVVIVAEPDKPSECPAGTEPVYASPGGMRDIIFLGCAQTL